MGGMRAQSLAGAPVGPLVLFVGAMVLAAALIVTREAGATEPEAAGWRVGEILGEARIRPPEGAWHVLRKGDAIQPDSEIETGPVGRLHLAGPAGDITVLPGSRIGFRGPAGAPGAVSRIIQRAGSLQVGIAADADAPLRITTPFLVATIAKATFTVTVNDRNAALYVSDGAARVMSVLTGEAAVVAPEYMAWVNAPSGGRLKTIAIRPNAAPDKRPHKSPAKSPAQAPRTGGRALALLAIARRATA